MTLLVREHILGGILIELSPEFAHHRSSVTVQAAKINRQSMNLNL